MTSDSHAQIEAPYQYGGTIVGSRLVGADR